MYELKSYFKFFSVITELLICQSHLGFYIVRVQIFLFKLYAFAMAAVHFD